MTAVASPAMNTYDVTVENVGRAVTALGAAGPFTVVIDRPVEAGGGGLGFSGGQLLHVAVAGCISNDLFREADKRGISLRHVAVRVTGDFAGSPAVSTGIGYEVDVEGDAPREELEELVRHVDAIAEIPNSLRLGTRVELTATRIDRAG